jgi:predicted CXXCH cytochrome family protein
MLGIGPDPRGRRQRTRPSRWLVWTLAVALASAAGVQGLGCATPEQRHRVLTFFFDDVPPLYPVDIATTPEELADLGDELPGGSKPPAWIVSVHGPVSKRECDLCHASRYSNRLNQKAEEICWDCHEPEDFPGQVVHGPVASGNCNGCHDPHRSEYPNLLVRAEAELCEHCHDEQSFARLEEHRATDGEDCQRCHDPHAADGEYMLKRDEEAS